MRALNALSLLALSLLAACPTPVGNGPSDAGVASGDAGIVICVDDQQCGTGHCLNGFCSSDQCTAKADCAATEVCLTGQCGPPPATCTSSEQCPGTEVCDGFSKVCFDPNHPQGEGEGEGGAAGEGEGEGEGEGSAGEGEGETIDLSGYVLENRENDPVSQASVIPDGTTLFAGHTLVIGRSASKAEFSDFWGGTLASTVLYLNGDVAGSGVPIINGGEKWALVDPDGHTVDGTTIAGSEGKSYRRTNPGSASSASHWDEADDTSAHPGQNELGAGTGLLISAWSDASGSGNFKFEFIELSWQP